MTTIQLEAGTLTASAEDRVISGLLLPYGEHGNTNLGRVLVPRETVEIPSDLSILNLNSEHRLTEPRGRFLTATETAAGIVATFRVGSSPEGDELLAAASTEPRPSLSVELHEPVIRAGRLIKAKLSGAAVVAHGAFPSAALFASDVGELEPTDPQTTPQTQTQTQETPDMTATPAVLPASPAAAPATPPAAPAPQASSPGDLIAAQAPATYTQPRPEAAPAALLASFFAAADAARNGDTAALYALEGNSAALFAKFATTAADVPYDAAGAPGNAARLPQWLGELWSGDTREREIIDLLGGTGELTSLESRGWRFKTKPTVAKWAGNLAPITGSKAETEPYTTKAQRFAGGNSLAIEYQHFGETEMTAAIMRLLAESYAEVSDAYALELVLAAARANPVVVAAAPSHVPGAVARIVRGARRMRAARAKISFALVAENDYEEILWTKDNDKLANLAPSFNLEEGQAIESRIRPRAELASGQVVLVDKRAFQLLELPGVPIRVNAVDVARGGWDEALFGYVGHRLDFPAGVQLTTTATTTATTP